jgi:hypothetical protein
MADTEKRREIKSRADAKEAGGRVGIKELLQESVITTDRTLRRQGRVNKKETLPTSQ